MGFYGDLLNKLDDSLYIKIGPGKPAQLRLMDHPWISQKSFTDNETGEVSIRTQYHWPVWDYDQQRVRILTQGKTIFEEIAKNCEKWPQGEEMPSVFDVIIERKGTGKYDTKYMVTALPQRGTMPSIPQDQLPDMADKSKGIPIRQVLEGKTPPMVGQGTQVPALPTHTDAAALEKDVVITDIPDDPLSQIDVDKIPF